MLGTVTILYRFTLFQPLYTCTRTNLGVTYSRQIRWWSETTLILTNESQPNITRLIRVDQSQVSKLSKPQTDKSTLCLPCLVKIPRSVNFQRMCLQSHLQTSLPTPQKSCPKFQNPRTTLPPPCPPKYSIVRVVPESFECVES
jgi:hypothetical protein